MLQTEQTARKSIRTETGVSRLRTLRPFRRRGARGAHFATWPELRGSPTLPDPAGLAGGRRERMALTARPTLTNYTCAGLLYLADPLPDIKHPASLFVRIIHSLPFYLNKKFKESFRRCYNLLSKQDYKFELKSVIRGAISLDRPASRVEWSEAKCVPSLGALLHSASLGLTLLGSSVGRLHSSQR